MEEPGYFLLFNTDCAYLKEVMCTYDALRVS